MQQFSHPGRSLVELSPTVSADTLLADLTPPPEFSEARFSTYIPDPNFPSQIQAVHACRDFLSSKRRFFGKKESAPGIYLDGGFGVGKTHLLASIWHQHKGKKLFGAFLDMTAITGYLGFAEMAKRLSDYELICIDEFELDDVKWEQIMKAREYYETENVVPPIRKFAKYVGKDKKELFDTWNTGPMKPISKYGGLPKPTGCV